MSKEIRINRNKIDLTIHFNTIQELKQQLQDYEEIWKTVEDKIGANSFENKTVSKELENLCEFKDNVIVLKKSLTSPLHAVIFTLYAYGPKGTSNEEISLSTGIDKPSSKIITPTKNKKYFRKLENGKWYLSNDGLQLVPKIINNIKGE